MSAAAKRTLLIRPLGRQSYTPVWEAMKRFTNDRTEDTPDEIWVVQHDPVFTLGQAGKPEHVLMPGDIPVIKVDRGGQVTYHGPGQLVFYFLLDVRRLGCGPRRVVTALEDAVITLLKSCGITALSDPEAPGVYVDGAKIASLGLRFRKSRSYHGLSLNVAMDLEPFNRINPCGYPGLEVTQMSDLLDQVSIDDVRDQLLQCFMTELGYNNAETIIDTQIPGVLLPPGT